MDPKISWVSWFGSKALYAQITTLFENHPKTGFFYASKASEASSLYFSDLSWFTNFQSLILAQCVRWSLIEQTSVVELSTCPMCWVPSEQIFSPNFLDACLTMSANQRRRIQSRNGPGKKLSTLLSFREAAGLTNRSRTTARWSASITLTISCKKMWYYT